MGYDCERGDDIDYIYKMISDDEEYILTVIEKLNYHN